MHRALLSWLLLASSPATCPWLTQGSASRLLGGEVSIKVNLSSTGGFCTFLLPPRDSLRILVSKAALASCPQGSTQLKGIGNQAASCRTPGSRRGSHADMISGRVRDLYFTVTVNMPAAPEDALEQIAEQIAGNLF